MFASKTIFAVLAMSLALTAAAASDPVAGQAVPKPQQFLYVLKVTTEFHDPAKWTATQNDAVDRHFARLAAAAKSGKLILAGKTSEPLDVTFGLVVFEADDEAAARLFMETDPAVVAGVMSATLHPYAVALQRGP